MMYDQLFQLLSAYRRGAIILLALIPTITFGMSWIHGVYDGRSAPWRQLYALAVHLVTLALATVVAAVALHLYEGGGWSDPSVPRVVLYVLLGSWVLTLLTVKRALDFRYIATVRNPLVLLLGWLAGWTAGAGLYITGLWLIPGPPVYTALTAALLVFVILQMVFSLFRPRR